MRRGVVVSVVNQKGGVGKTTTVCHLGWYLAHQGLRVLMVDTDPQGNLTSGNGYRNTEVPCLYDLIAENQSFDKVVLKARPKREDLCWDLIASNKRTASFDMYAMRRVQEEIGFVPAFILDDAFDKHKGRYDVILVDAPPTQSLMHNAVVAMADYVLIPTQLARFSADGVAELLNTINTVSKLPGMRAPALIGVLPVEYKGRQNETKIVAGEIIANVLGGNKSFFLPPIPMSVDFDTAHSSGVTVYEYRPNSPGIIGFKADEKGLNVHKLTGGYDHVGEIVHFFLKDAQRAAR